MLRTLTSLLFTVLALFFQTSRPEGLLTDLSGGNGDALIRSAHPRFSWQLPSCGRATMQSAFRIVLSDSLGHCIWDSGRVDSGESVAVTYSGPALEEDCAYSWKVKVWNRSGQQSRWSLPRHFKTAPVLDGAPAHRKLVMTPSKPQRKLSEGNLHFFDFGKAAFGRICIRLDNTAGGGSFILRLGENCDSDRVQRKPQGNIRYCEYEIPIEASRSEYLIEFRPDPRNTDHSGKYNESDVRPVLMPSYIGEVYPFRYCEVELRDSQARRVEAVRYDVNYPFDDKGSRFTSSDTVLNRVWELCKHSIKATSFCGIYVDGDRERIAYEADALINQLCHYGVDREDSMARRTLEHLIDSPTWPTEWCLQTLIIAWNDYMYTGDDALLRRRYPDLKAKTLMALADENGLISTRTGLLTKEVEASIHFRGQKMRDIVDWPQKGEVGPEKEMPGETDGFVFTDYNTVVNAFHYKAVNILASIADVLGLADEASSLKLYCRDFLKKFNESFITAEGLYRDGIGTSHCALHSNMLPLAFGMVPGKNVAVVSEFVKSRRMACSVYGAQFLLDAMYLSGQGEYALSLMSSTAERSWYNMIRLGSTVTLEAWDNRYKPNLDWNHAWGAVPAGAIPRGLLGVSPMEPGFRKARIQPQFGSLKSFEAKVPTIRGAIEMKLRRGRLTLRIPANMEAGFVCSDGSTLELGPGKHQIDL